ncbi:MAG TPA: right-handed parallel beta-helix repeat-containing protein [Vicinamibacteria bacterium]|nr:right-handed parallel beta-helix repeat-containing protein [Vicinamibacteria bacterium]
MDHPRVPGIRIQAASAGVLVFLLALAPLLVRAQPSGGPYGPIPQSYPPPKAAHVYYVAPDGRAEAAGATLAEPTTLEAAFERVVSGDAIVMRGGTYRTGGLRLNQGITWQPYADEHPVLKGTRVATEWRALRNKVWRTSWPTLFPARPLGWWQRDREGMRTPLHRFNNDMVFVDGELLRSAGWEGELDEHSFYVDYEAGQVYIGTDPTNRLVEITAFDSAFVRTSGPCHGKTSDKKGPTIRGLTFTQYAYRAIDIEGKKPATPVSEEPTDDPMGPAEPGTYGREVVGTTLENVTISFCSRVAGYFRGDGLTLRNSLISDTSTEGFYVIGSSDVLLERNVFRRNNVEELTGYYPAAVKIFNQSRRVTCRDNLVIEQPHSNGIWYDVGNVDAVFVDNWIEGAVDGFFFEISKGATVAGNVFVGCDKGIRVLNSSNVRVYHNTLVDSVASFERTERSAVGDHFGWHPRTGPDVDEREGHVFVGNLLFASASFRKPLLRFEQPKALCIRLVRPQVKELDGNVYVRAGGGALPLVVWSPVEGETCQVELGSLEDLRKLQPALEARGRSFSDYVGALFRSPELSNYELARPLPSLQPTDDLPPEVARLLGWPAAQARTPGAYPLPTAASPRGDTRRLLK